MNINDFTKSKENHDSKILNENYIGPDKPIDTETPWNCLNIARKRMSYNIPGNTMEKSFVQALNTAEGTDIFSVVEKENEKLHKVILKNLKDDWKKDHKFINAPLGEGFEVGNTITWETWKNQWLIVWQDLGAKGYFRGEIQKATHLLKWKNENGVVQQQWAVVEGPVETRLKNEQTRGSSVLGKQNDTLEILIGANSDGIKSLKRYTRLMVGGRVWEINVRDDISNENVYRFSLVEDFSNPELDDYINAIPFGEVDFAQNNEPTSPEIEGVFIVGPSRVREKVSTEFKLVDSKENPLTQDVSWEVENAKLWEVEDGKLYVIGKKIGDVVVIKATHPKGENLIECKVVSAFTQI